MVSLRTASYVVGGAVIGFVGAFVPLLRIFAPFLGGAVAGYAHDEGTKGGAIVGVAVAVLTVTGLVTFGLLAFAVLWRLGTIAGDPEAAAALRRFGGFMALIWVVLYPAWALPSATGGGVAGGMLAERSGESNPRHPPDRDVPVDAPADGVRRRDRSPDRDRNAGRPGPATRDSYREPARRATPPAEEDPDPSTKWPGIDDE